MQKHLWIAAVVALASTAAACSSDEPSSTQDYPQPAASIGDEATPEELGTDGADPAPAEEVPATNG